MSHARDVAEAKRMKVLEIYAGRMSEGGFGRPGFRIEWGRVFGNPNEAGA